MKNKVLLGMLCFLTAFTLTAQTYEIDQVNGDTITTCSGLFYDSGGASGLYGSLENYTVTFCSTNGVIFINFESIVLAANDVLTIYNGPSTASPVLATYQDGTFSGIVSSTCGCLTIKFVSTLKVFAAGWVGQIGCRTSNDYIFNAITPPLNGDCLTGQTNVGATADYSFGCFSSGNTVWYGFSLTAGNNTIDVTLQNAGFPNVQYALVYDFNCQTSGVSLAGTQCVPVGDTVQWTGLTEGYYWLGISSVTEGAFDLCITESYNDICGDFFCGPGESCLSCPFDCGNCPEPIGGPYFHPASGIQNTYLGMCMIGLSEGLYYDNGGPGSTYSNNINQIYRTFCPNTPNTALRATISQMGIEYSTSPVACLDRLWVGNGPTQNSPIIWTGCGNTNIPYAITYSGLYNNGVFTSTHPSGCLTFRFASGAANSGYWEGWEIDLDTVYSALGPSATYANDCVRSIPICDDYTISSQIWGPGLSSEGCGGCVTSENFTEWYRIHVSSGGIMEFEITPLGNSDMDFAIYKADSCGDIGSPLRCSFAAYAPPGKTGLSVNAGDISEDVTGDQWVAELEIKENERYFIMVNEWNKDQPNAYTLDFKLSGGASFDCSEVLPVSFYSFTGNAQQNSVELIWKTASEINNNYFTVERSQDAFNYTPLATIDGAGNSNTILRYVYNDLEPVKGMAYYRIKQTDFDGQISFSNVVAIDFLNDAEPWLSMYPNPSSDALFVSCDAAVIDNAFTIYNAIGIEVLNGTIENTYFKIPVTDLEEGAYYLTLDGKTKHSFMVIRSKD